MNQKLFKFIATPSCLVVIVPVLLAQVPAQSTTGWSANAIPVLRRQAVGTPDSNLMALLDALALKSSLRERRRDGIRAAGDGWRVDIFGDGSGAEFVNQSVSSDAHRYAVDPSRAMSNQALDSAGRDYINRMLSRVVVLQPGERLVPETTSLHNEGGVARDGTAPYSAVVEARVSFSREINGIPVVGNGSKVTITFRGDGAVESFRYDWPRYVRGNIEQRLATPIEILRRVQLVAGTRARAEVAAPITAPPNIERITQPMTLGGGVQLQDLRCGYYDPGLMNRSESAPLQAGCYYHLIQSQGQPPYVTTAAYSGAVPAATSPQPDGRWPEAEVLRNRQPKAPGPPRTAGSADKPRPVPPRPGNQGK